MDCEQLIIPPRDLLLLPDLMVELDRVDVDFWGNCRTATIMRCVIAADWRDDRPAKLMGIADTLGVGTSTVHDHVTRLTDPARLPSCYEAPVPRRVPRGYRLTAYGDGRARRWAAAVAKVLDRFAPPARAAAAPAKLAAGG